MQLKGYILYSVLLVIGWVNAGGQTDSEPVYVSWKYQNQPLEEVLIDISQTYPIHFSYSRDFLLMERKITAHAHNQPINTALERLFSKTDVVFAQIGSQFVLKRDPDKLTPKQPEILKIKNEFSESPGEQGIQSTPDHTVDSLAMDNLEQDSLFAMAIDTVGEDVEKAAPDTLSKKEKRLERRKDKTALVELMLMPGYEVRSPATADKRRIHINLFYGKHEKLEGIEAGLLVNEISENAEGIQVAGIYNRVDGRFGGFQYAGFVNQVHGSVEGLQMAGLLNTSGNHYGIQASGLGNISHGHTHMQVGSAFNITAERSRFQAAGIINVANVIEGGQVSGFVNVAEKVNGFQLGLINIADTISGPSIGLLNFIRKGYNHVELFAAEALYTNLSIKLGSHSFYNIVEAGTNMPFHEFTSNSRTWAIGYGFGFHRKIGKNKPWGMNMELTASQVNEGTFWQKEVNLLARGRILWSREKNGEQGIFFGPTFNVMISQWTDPDTGEFLSKLAPYTLLEEESTNTLIQGWIGWQIGFRF